MPAQIVAHAGGNGPEMADQAVRYGATAPMPWIKITGGPRLRPSKPTGSVSHFNPEPCRRGSQKAGITSAAKRSTRRAILVAVRYDVSVLR